jgi:hypothetical protein
MAGSARKKGPSRRKTGGTKKPSRRGPTKSAKVSTRLGTTPLVLYSTNTWLAYTIAEKYYKQVHYAWCSPYFDARNASSTNRTIPPSSSPLEVYQALSQEVGRGDRHSAKIGANRIGILRGSGVKLAQGVITKEEKQEIAEIVELAQVYDFRPVLYVIPFALVGSLVRSVAVSKRAHPLSDEYIIEALPRRFFDVIEFL